MSAIPPPGASSIVGSMQAGGRADAAKAKSEKEQSRNVDSASFSDQFENLVRDAEQGDDTNADAEGRGGHGGAFGEGGDSEASADEQPRDDSVDGPGGGLDLEA